MPLPMKRVRVDAFVEHENTQGVVKSWKVQANGAETFFAMSMCKHIGDLDFEIPAWLAAKCQLSEVTT